MLQFVEFKKSYGAQTVLKLNDLIIPAGLAWIKGANGSGKSTLLRTAGGILDFDGDIVLDQTLSVKRHPVAYRKHVNFAEAEPVFPDFLTGLDLIRLFSAAKKGPHRQAEYFIESMMINSFVGEPLGTYSTGMLKKLSLLLAFIGTPQIILLDEPLITLDDASSKILYTWIREKQKADNTSFLLSSHQPPGNDLFVACELIVDMQTAKLIPR